ncbi:MAG: hypothetical protein K2X55_00085 [Burkholderiaceae bacterium]|nr:hypothetical protein [Burkholderiaceae bacterium]
MSTRKPAVHCRQRSRLDDARSATRGVLVLSGALGLASLAAYLLGAG